MPMPGFTAEASLDKSDYSCHMADMTLGAIKPVSPSATVEAAFFPPPFPAPVDCDSIVCDWIGRGGSLVCWCG